MGNRRLNFKILLFYLLVIMAFVRCAGTVNTIRQRTETSCYEKAYIVSAENSNYIKFKFGVITPYAYIILPDDPAQKHRVIGNTDAVIQKELQKYGVQSEIGKRDDVPDGFDLVVLYNDTWRWDMKKVLDKLEIVFISPEGNRELARSTYTIYKNKEFHNFPTPEKEVPKMIKELLSK
jgi:hypothetical protein